MSVLAAIPGPAPGTKCYLRRDVAAAWNAMSKESVRRGWGVLRPLGYMSAYRTYDQQVYLWNHSAHPHDTNWVARPGTSNHGWGLAIDLQSQHMRWVVDRIGREYGFAKRWSDAPLEWWHVRWREGVWTPPKRFIPLRHDSRGERVRWVQRRLRAKGFKSVAVTGFFGDATESAVKRFQRAHHLSPDGVVGPTTWQKLSL